MEEQIRAANAIQAEGLRGVLISREREVGSPVDEVTPPPVDDYATRLVKYIPGEVLAVYVAMSSILAGAENPGTFLPWAVFLFGFVSTPLYLARIGKVKGLWHPLVSTGAFFVWVFALGGPFASLAWYDPVYGALLLPAYTFSIPLIVRPPTSLT
jgi:hypothetical protein